MTEQMDQKHDVPIMSPMGTVFENTPKMSNLTLLCFLTQKYKTIVALSARNIVE